MMNNSKNSYKDCLHSALRILRTKVALEVVLHVDDVFFTLLMPHKA